MDSPSATGTNYGLISGQRPPLVRRLEFHLSVSQLVLAALCLVLGIAQIASHTVSASPWLQLTGGVQLWTPAFFFAAGVTGILAVRRSELNYVVAHLVACVLAIAVDMLLLIVTDKMMITAISSQSMSFIWLQMCITCIAGLEMIVALASAALCCRQVFHFDTATYAI